MSTSVLRLWLALAATAALGAASSPPVALQCTLAAQGEARFQLMVKNVSSVPIDGEFFTAVELASTPLGSIGQYWAPIDVETGRPYGENQPRRLALQPGQVMTVVFAPDALLWDRTLSSKWPGLALSQIVPDGSYALYVRVEERETADRTESNRLVVALHDGVLRVDPRVP